jgi:uncharacterized membrane protein YkvA (DUF1232 family)
MAGTDLIPYDPAKLAQDEAKVRSGFWRKLKRVVARIPFAEDLLAAYFCAMDRATPTYVRAVLFGALAYFILPADAIPDIAAVVGFTDDAAVLAAAIAAVRAHFRPEHRDRAKAVLADRLAGDLSNQR